MKRAASPQRSPKRSAADDFLVSLARADVQGARGVNQSAYDEMLTAIVPGLDWGSVLKRADHHGLTPLLTKHLSALVFDGHVPQAVREQLRGAFTLSAGRHMWARAELEQVLVASNAYGCEPIVLKGIPLAERVYEDPALRPFGDADLLIKESQWQVFRAALLGEGLEPNGQDRAVLPPRLIPEDMLDHCLSFRSRTGLFVEVKLDPLELGLQTRSLAGLWERSVGLPMGAGVARRLDVNDELLMLCVHLNRHGYSRLMWWLDIARLIVAKQPEIDWRALVDRAKHEGLRPSVFFGLAHIDGLFGDLVPGTVLAELRPSWVKSRVWLSMWPEADVHAFNGAHEKGLIFNKSLRSKWLVPNLVLTGRIGKKALYFLRKLLPPAEFLSRKYAAGATQSYLKMLLARYSLVTHTDARE